MTDGDSHFLMSLNDTLTCGLGASVLLFVLFVMLVSLEEPIQGRRSSDSAAPDTRAVEASEESGRVEAVLTVRVMGACNFIRTVSGGQDDIETAIFIDKRGRGHSNRCVAVLRPEQPSRTAGVSIVSEGVPEGRIVVTATWGGRNLTEPNEFEERHFPRNPGGTGGPRLLARIVVDDDRRPIQWAQ